MADFDDTVHYEDASMGRRVYWHDKDRDYPAIIVTSYNRKSLGGEFADIVVFGYRFDGALFFSFIPKGEDEGCWSFKPAKK